VPLINLSTLFSAVSFFSNDIYNQLLVGLLIIIALIFLLTYLLKTDFGIAMRATGNSATMTKALGH
jgi:putative ABC transport system permease protein